MFPGRVYLDKGIRAKEGQVPGPPPQDPAELRLHWDIDDSDLTLNLAQQSGNAIQAISPDRNDHMGGAEIQATMPNRHDYMGGAEIQADVQGTPTLT